MKKSCLIAVAVLMVCMIPSLASAQGAVKKGPEIMREPDMEKDSLHNLDVARQYFKLKKAYVAALQRCEEVLAANPDFSKIDEVLFIAGQSSLYLASSKGKQQATQYVIHDGDKKTTLSSDEFKEKARGYLNQLVVEHPQSSFRGQAEESLKSMGEPKQKTTSGL